MMAARVAIVHDWLTGMRGGERVLEALLDIFPAAEIFTLLHVPGSVSPRIEERPIHTSMLSRVPGAAKRYRWALPIFPSLIERFDLRDYELIISSSHCVAKGVLSNGTPHLCYCHTPMRYVWDQFGAYFAPERTSLAVRAAARLTVPRLRRWDVRSARRVTAFVANSAFVRDRIRTHWGRDADVIHPPVDIDRFRPARRRADTYVIVSALVPYKRIDLAIAAFNRLGRPLLIVGDGPDRARLERQAGPNIRFTGRVPDAEVAEIVAGARGFVLPGEEDFGIAVVEAQAAGTPVIALARGGALETVIDDDDPDVATGVFFHQPTPTALADAVRRFETREFKASVLRANAERFGPAVFDARMRERVAALLEDRGAPCASPM